MKILFICGSLEPGRDGVGDYVRRLAAEIIRQGHMAAALALNDTYLPVQFVGTQVAAGLEVEVFRAPSVQVMRDNFKKIKEWVTDFDPQWLSLQFVPFAFHAKGLPFRLSSLLQSLGSGSRWHIMFHELWVGMDKNASVKDIWWGKLQSLLIKKLVYHLRPASVHTQSQLYLMELASMDIKAAFLPLFANIPVSSNKTCLAKNFSFVLFGTIHPDAPVKQFAAELAAVAHETYREASLTIVGRCGREQERWVKVCREAGVALKVLGEQPPETISKVMKEASFGIATTPAALCEKSGAVAAMLCHGLPVLCISKPWQPRSSAHIKLPSGVTEYKSGGLASFMQNHSIRASSNDVGSTAHQFLNSLLTTA